MKSLRNQVTVPIPAGVTVDVKASKVRVKGPRGSLERSFKVARLHIYKESPESLVVDCWLGDTRKKSQVSTICSHIANMITGVTKGYLYKMKFVYAHFPLNVNLTNDGTTVEIRNFLGEKRTRIVNMAPGVEVIRSANVKDQIEISGNSIEDVSRSCALIHQSCIPRNKDIRKFLDGIYVSEKGFIVEDDE